MSYPKLIENLLDQLVKLPGVGRRSAERMVYWFLNHTKEESEEFAAAIIRLKEGLRFCRQCHHLSEGEICAVCQDDRRDKSTLCVVEDPKDVIAIEKTGAYKGRYHVLLGTISPAEGRGPDDLKIAELMTRIKSEAIHEVVIATDADNEGEMTSLYLIKQLKPLGVRVSRIGFGLPVGSSVEYSDMSTLSMSLNSRREVLE
ncbi:MAG: recombination protein RecR [Candidatus Omnitrophica bacterium]|nr:recombination protein RecR [Candidatus Omnitrophota bacterium]